jgi:catechol 2,3-dioxygenase
VNAPIDPRAHIAAVTLNTADVERLRSFYGDVLGLGPVPDSEALAALGADGRRPLVRLVEAAAGVPARPRRATGLFHTAIRYPERADLADALRRVAGAGVRLSGASDHGVSEALYLDDPEGNGVELYWDRPREAWPRPPDGQGVEMFTAPLDLHDLLAVHGGDATGDGVDVGHVHLKVSELERAVGFWVGALGLEVQALWDGQAAFVSAGGYHHHIGLNTWMSGGGPAPAPGSPGLERITVALPDSAAMDATVAGLREAGVEVTEGEGGAHYARDPDGVLLELRVV